MGVISGARLATSLVTWPRYPSGVSGLKWGDYVVYYLSTYQEEIEISATVKGILATLQDLVFEAQHSFSLSIELWSLGTPFTSPFTIGTSWTHLYPQPSGPSKNAHLPLSKRFQHAPISPEANLKASQRAGINLPTILPPHASSTASHCLLTRVWSQFNVIDSKKTSCTLTATKLHTSVLVVRAVWRYSVFLNYLETVLNEGSLLEVAVDIHFTLLQLF
jgi:hypothetical protein